MRTTGIVRRLRNFGCFVIPVKLLKYLHIEPGDLVEFFLDEGIGIVLRKYEPNCVFCGEVNRTSIYKGKKVCGKCLEEIKGK